MQATAFSIPCKYSQTYLLFTVSKKTFFFFAPLLPPPFTKTFCSSSTIPLNEIYMKIIKKIILKAFFPLN